MKLIDRYKISLHNIKNNKSRSILTTVIVYIISLLIMTTLCIGISFSNNMSKVIEEYYQKSNEPIYTIYRLHSDSVDGRVFDKETYATLSPQLEEHQSIISYVKYATYWGENNAFIGDHRFAINDYYEIIEGDNIGTSDSATNAVLVSAKYAADYYSSTGKKLNAEDLITYPISYAVKNSDNSTSTETKDLQFKVKGIYKLKDVDPESTYSVIINSSTEIILDVQYMFDNIPNVYLTGGEYYYNITKTNFNSSELEDKLDAFVTELNNILPQDKYGDTASCYALIDLSMSHLTGLIVIVVACVLCLILILLSIGSLSNTIMISVDKNKKFIGLLKALGLNEGDLKSTIKLESITTIVLGIILSFLTIVVFQGILSDLNALIINSLFSNYVKAINYQVVFSLPIYVPIIVLIFFIAFTLLFARNSMSKIAKTDPIEVISEVA